jgi:hypothetical protein
MKVFYKLACSFMIFGAAVSAQAHHSFGAIFDSTQERTLTGVFSKVEWINPHSYYYVDVKNTDGSVTKWAFESFPPQMLRGLGLSREQLVSNIGKTVTVRYNPAHKKDESLGYGRVLEFEGGPRIVFTPDNSDGTTPKYK